MNVLLLHCVYHIFSFLKQVLFCICQVSLPYKNVYMIGYLVLIVIVASPDNTLYVYCINYILQNCRGPRQLTVLELAGSIVHRQQADNTSERQLASCKKDRQGHGEALEHIPRISFFLLNVFTNVLHALKNVQKSFKCVV